MAGPSRQYSTLPRKLPGDATFPIGRIRYPSWWERHPILIAILFKSGRPPQPPKRDPRTTLSVGRARARSMVVALTEMGKALKQRWFLIPSLSNCWPFIAFRLLRILSTGLWREWRRDLLQFIVTDGFHPFTLRLRQGVHHRSGAALDSHRRTAASCASHEARPILPADAASLRQCG